MSVTQMSAEDNSVRASAKEFERSLKKLVSTSVKRTKEIVATTFPQLSDLMDKVVEDSERTVNDLFKGFDKMTSKEQLQMLQAYRKLLAAQLEKIDSRINQLSREKSSEDVQHS
ncbi:MAG: DUF5320 domain-containing protein [Thermoprotei archaeon]